MLEIEDADLAFLSLETTEENFPFIALNDSDALEVGDLVLAIGNPFGVGQTVTSGIVSAVSRTGVVQRGNNLFIQTDAAINPGNSGGALVDMSGRLVGINTAIFSRSGGSNGIGFAIPANLIAAYVRDLKTGQASSVPWLGFQGDDLTNDLAREKGLLRAGGVVVDVIFNGGPADKAGINQGDVIVAVNGVEVVDQLSMLYRLRLAEPYSPVTLEVDSGDEISTVLINPIDPPEIPEANTTLLDGNHPFSGMVVSNLSPKAARDRGVAGRWKGVIVDRIYRGSVAGRYGFRVGDILLSLNGKQLTSLDDLDLAALEGRRRWDVKFERNGRVNSLRLFR
ncbi:MAG: trypsin-like peptidase domain-containing protein [Alphaproteobacteria bacterium]